MPCLIRIDHQSLPFSVLVEDDGRVAYAYLMHRDAIIGDVWLYNCGTAPTEPEWRDRSKAPFANPRGFVVETDVTRIAATEDLTVSWINQGDDVSRAELCLRNELLAILVPGTKPGWCRNALKDGPLAKVLSAEIRNGDCAKKLGKDGLRQRLGDWGSTLDT